MDDDEYDEQDLGEEGDESFFELYRRQNLVSDLRVPHTVTVIGVGGVGSYAAIFMALVGARRIILVDPDIVEESNRNRVLFRYYDVSATKVDAIGAIISALRRDVIIDCYAYRIEDVDEEGRKKISTSDVVFDCRDIVDCLPDWVPKCKITGGYDGKRVTMHLNPDLSKIWSVGSMTYTETPSYCVPPALIGVLMALYTTSPSLEVKDEKIVSFNVDKLFNEVIDHDRI